MDTKLLKELLMSPDGFSEVRRFCEGLEEYNKARAEMDAWYEKLEEMLGYDELSKLSDAALHCCCLENQAYYIFGLHVRDELKQALML